MVCSTGHRRPVPVPHRVFAQPKPKWVRAEIIRLKALMPEAGCRTIAHLFNRRWKARKQMTVSKTYVADLCQRHQYLIYEARRKLKHRIPRLMPRNRIWGCDLLMKTDDRGTPHVALAIVDHASRASLRLRALSDKSSMRLLQELVQPCSATVGHNSCERTMKPYSSPAGFESASGCWGSVISEVSRDAPGRTGESNGSLGR